MLNKTKMNEIVTGISLLAFTIMMVIAAVSLYVASGMRI